MPLLEISIVPVGTNTASFSSYVKDAQQLIESKGLQYQITPTSTVIEGNIDDLMDVAKSIHQQALSNGSDRVITNMIIDDRTDKPLTLNEQMAIVSQSTQ